MPVKKNFRSSITKPIGDANYIQKKLPNTKRGYEDVRSSLNTGATVSNVIKKLDTRGEIFKRINRTSLNKLMKAADAQDESVYDFQGDAVSEYSVVTTAQTELDLPNISYILLDMRDPDAFAVNHLDGGMPDMIYI